VPHPKPMVEEGSARSTKIAHLKATNARHYVSELPRRAFTSADDDGRSGGLGDERYN